MAKIIKIDRIYPYVLAIGGSVGMIAMTWQASERIHMLKHPDLALSCNLSPIVDCGGVLDNHLSAIFGFPNAFLGMIFFTILATSGLMLLAGGALKNWYRHFVIAVSLVLFLFSTWFFGVSLYILGKICIFCVAGWVVTMPLFWYGLLFYLSTATGRLKQKSGSFLSFSLKHHLDVLLLIYVVMIALYFIRFNYYYFS